jgi:hypothetical protein
MKVLDVVDIQKRKIVACSEPDYVRFVRAHP